ncbi:MAG: serine hydrolase domain-containing protein [Actinoplanes sp.]
MTTDTKSPRSFRKTAVALAAAVTLTGSGVAATAANAARPGPPGDTLMLQVAQRVMAAGPPGYVARIDNGQRVFTMAAGVADRATGRPMRVRDQFEAGSNTKTFMAVLALQLVDRGRLDLDAPVSKYLPGVVPNGRNITVRMLLNHSSGLFSYTSDPDFFGNMNANPQHVYTEEELLAIAFEHEPNFAPGAGWSYSNTNYTLIGMILQKLTGKDLPDLVRQRITGPLGLRHTYFADPRATNTGRGYAHGYAIEYASGTPAYTDTASWPIGGWGGAAGAMISTADDLARFFSAVLGGELFSAEQLKQMKTTVPLPADFPFTGGYGLGLMKNESPCGTVWGHGGDTMGHHSTAVTTEDGRRTAVTDATGEPNDPDTNAGVERYYQVILFGADTVTTCRMLGKPVPADVLQNLRGITPAPSAE